VVHRRVVAGEHAGHDFSTWFPGTTLESALTELSRPPAEDLVVCHGDACVPNTLIGDDGHVVGHVDVGSLGVGDRWADLAVLAWSTIWNYGPGFEDVTYEGYGIEPNERAIRYYRLLWELA
jgi:kanamycin kinase